MPAPQSLPFHSSHNIFLKSQQSFNNSYYMNGWTVFHSNPAVLQSLRSGLTHRSKIIRKIGWDKHPLPVHVFQRPTRRKFRVTHQKGYLVSLWKRDNDACGCVRRADDPERAWLFGCVSFAPSSQRPVCRSALKSFNTEPRAALLLPHLLKASADNKRERQPQPNAELIQFTKEKRTSSILYPRIKIALVSMQYCCFPLQWLLNTSCLVWIASLTNWLMYYFK